MLVTENVNVASVEAELIDIKEQYEAEQKALKVAYALDKKTRADKYNRMAKKLRRLAEVLKAEAANQP